MPPGDTPFSKSNQARFWRKCFAVALARSLHDALTSSVIIHSFKVAGIYSKQDMDTRIQSLPTHPEILTTPFSDRKPEISGYILTETNNMAPLIERKRKQQEKMEAIVAKTVTKTKSEEKTRKKEDQARKKDKKSSKASQSMLSFFNFFIVFIL